MAKYYDNVARVLLLVFMIQIALDLWGAHRMRAIEQLEMPPFALITKRTSGRLGDQLLMYVKQKWVCWKYGGKLLHVPFPQSSLFALHNHEEHYSAQHHDKAYKKRNGLVQSTSDIKCDGSLYTLGFWFHDAEMVRDCFKDTEFRNVVRKALEPTIAIPLITLPNDGLTVALHVRKGEGYDGTLLSAQRFVSPPYTCVDENFVLSFPCPVAKHASHIDEKWPLRFPPDQFYIDQLLILASMFPHTMIYVYLFTDVVNPQSLAEKYQKELKDCTNLIIRTPSIGGHTALGQYSSAGMTIDYRNDEEYNTQLLSELFCMARCDVLIRGLSGLSLLAEIVGDHSVVVTPARYHWESKTLIMDTIIVRGADQEWVKDYRMYLEAYNVQKSSHYKLVKLSSHTLRRWRKMRELFSIS